MRQPPRPTRQGQQRAPTPARPQRQPVAAGAPQRAAPIAAAAANTAGNTGAKTWNDTGKKGRLRFAFYLVAALLAGFGLAKGFNAVSGSPGSSKAGVTGPQVKPITVYTR